MNQKRLYLISKPQYIKHKSVNLEEFRVSTSMCSSKVQWGEPQRGAVLWPGSVGEEQTLAR